VRWARACRELEAAVWCRLERPGHSKERRPVAGCRSGIGNPMTCNSRASGELGHEQCGAAQRSHVPTARGRSTHPKTSACFAPLPSRSQYPAAAQPRAEKPTRRKERVRGFESSPRHTLEGSHVIRDVVVRLPVAGEDRHLRISESSGVIECTPLQDDQAGREGRPGQQVCSAFPAKLPRHGIFQIRAPKGLGLPRSVAERLLRNSEADVRTTTRDVLTLAAVALRIEDRRRGDLVSHSTAVTVTGSHDDCISRNRPCPDCSAVPAIAVLSVQMRSLLARRSSRLAPGSSGLRSHGRRREPWLQHHLDAAILLVAEHAERIRRL